MLSLLEAAKLVLARVDGPCDTSVDDYDELRAAVDAELHRVKQVEVIVSGGVVQDVLNVPPDWDVVIKDYDVEGCEEGDTETDREGGEFVRLTWSGEQREKWEGGGA
jgi:hypothetical protein